MAHSARARLTHRTAGIVFFFLLWFCYAYVYQYDGWNQQSRLNLLHAVFEKGSLSIDAYHTNTGDKAVINGRYYSEKAPATVLLAAPGYLVGRTIGLALGIPPDSSRGWRFTGWFATVLSVGLIAALGGTALLLTLQRFVGRQAALVTSAGLFLGSLPWPYATMLFSHAGTVGLIAGCVYFLEHPQQQTWHGYAAGALAGLALAGEYSAGLVCTGLFVWSCLQGRATAIRFLGGAVPPLLLIPAYNWLAFGSPLSFGYMASATFASAHQQGFFGIVLPQSLSKVQWLLLSPARGLFHWTPFLLVALVGFASMRRTMGTARMVLCIVIPILHILCIGGFVGMGGAAVGPRYLAPLLPLLAWPAAFGWRLAPLIGTGLATVSIVLMGLATSINAMTPAEYTHPLFQLYIPRLLTSDFAPNLGHAWHLAGWWQLAPLVLVITTGLVVLWQRWASAPDLHD